MHCHCGTNNRAPRWTFTDPCSPEVTPGAREESASPAWLAAPAMNAHDTTKGIYRGLIDTGCGPTLYRMCHSHNTPGKKHNNTWVEHLAGNCTTTYMWRYRCAGGPKKKLYLYPRPGSQRHIHFAGFFNVPVPHRHGTNLFIRWFRDTAPFVTFYDTLGIWRTYKNCNFYNFFLDLP